MDAHNALFPAAKETLVATLAWKTQTVINLVAKIRSSSIIISGNVSSFGRKDGSRPIITGKFIMEKRSNHVHAASSMRL